MHANILCGMVLDFFITVRFLDLIDIFSVAFLLYQLYKLLKDSVTLHIFLGLSALYVLWLIVRALDMKMLSLILGQFMGVGVIALLVVFQPEIRRFFLLLGSKYFSQFSLMHLEELLKHNKSKHYAEDEELNGTIEQIETAVSIMSKDKTGALIVFSKHLRLEGYANTGVKIGARVHHEILCSIFFKNNPLHDGAVIIYRNEIVAAKVVLPLLNELELDERYGMRHRSALSMNIETGVPVIIVSEETGSISIAYNQKIIEFNSAYELKNFLAGV